MEPFFRFQEAVARTDLQLKWRVWFAIRQQGRCASGLPRMRVDARGLVLTFVLTFAPLKL